MSDEALVRRPDGADDEIEKLRGRLARARARTRQSVAGLRTELSTRTDWQTWYRAHPIGFLTTAFLLGLFLGRRR